MFYRVQCVDRATGDHSERLYHAPSPEAAAKMAMADGFVVGAVRADASGAAPPAPPSVTVPARLGAYTTGARPPAGVVAFFRFEALMFPVLVKWLFVLVTAAALVATVAIPVMWLSDGDFRTREGAVNALRSIGVTWGSWLALRLLAEFYIIVFAVHDRLREIEHNTRA